MSYFINKAKVRRWGLLLLAALLLVGCSGPIGRGDLKWHKLIASHSRYMDMGGYKLHYLDMGQGRPVVMIHGFADSTYCWHANAAALLKADLRLILVDQPGLGQSGIPPQPYTYSVENQAAAIMELCDRLGLKRFSLVGSSMGGGIALYLAWRYPGSVERMVLLDPACYEPPGIRWLTLPGAGYVASLLGGRRSVGRGLKSAYYRDDLVTDAVIDEYARPTQKKGYFQVLSQLSGQYFSPAFKAMTEAYGQIKTPALIIWGQFDTWVPPEFGRRLHKALAGSELKVIKDTGHLPHQEDSDAVNRLLIDFLTHGKMLAYRLNPSVLASQETVPFLIS